MKIKRISLVLVAFFICGVLNAQNIETVTASVQMDFPFQGGDQVITRNYKNTHFVTHFRMQVDTLTHVFTICKKPSGPVLRFATTFPMDFPSHITYCNVNDMQIFGDYCYFCGRMKIVEYDMATGALMSESTRGFWGYFSIADALTQNVLLRYDTVNTTYELYQMAVGQNATTGGLIVSAIGVCNDQTTACVAELVQSGSSWQQSVAVIDNVGDIAFADIVNVGGKFYMASYNRCSDNDVSDVRHWTFNVHASSYYGFGSDYANTWSTETAAQHNVQYLFGSPHTGWHTGDMTIKLCALAGGRFCLAYNGRDNDGTEGVIMLSQSDEFQVDTVLAFTDGAGLKLPNFENGCFEADHVTYYPKDDYYPETKYECVWKYIQIPIQVYWWEQARGGLYFEINTTCTEYPSGIVMDNEEDEENEEKRIE